MILSHTFVNKGCTTFLFWLGAKSSFNSVPQKVLFCCYHTAYVSCFNDQSSQDRFELTNGAENILIGTENSIDIGLHRDSESVNRASSSTSQSTSSPPLAACMEGGAKNHCHLGPQHPSLGMGGGATARGSEG